MDDAEAYVEAIAGIAAGADRSVPSAWFTGRGFETMPMRAGFLLTGTVAAFEETFGVAVGDRASNLSLPVPEELRTQVEFITIRAVPNYQS